MRGGCTETHYICKEEERVMDNFSAVKVHKQCRLVLVFRARRRK
jgi:hypothetical protein